MSPRFSHLCHSFTCRTAVTNSRRGVVVPFLLLSLTIFMLAFAVAVNKYWLWSVHEEMQTAADAAAFAAGAALADDDSLRGQLQRYPALMTRAANAAIALAEENQVRARSMTIADNLDNMPGGDIQFGALTRPFSNDFLQVAGRSSTSPNQTLVNTVVIKVQQTKNRGTAPNLVFGALGGVPTGDVQAVSVVTLDRGIRGFQFLYEPVPFAPLALLSDAMMPQSWERQVESSEGPDLVSYNATTAAFTQGADLIHEFEAVYATDTSQLPNANVVLVHLGSDDAANIPTQLDGGITESDLATMDGRFILPVVGAKAIAGQHVGPDVTNSTIRNIALSLEGLRSNGAIRIWPLYSGYDAQTDTVMITGFVAARVVSVKQLAPGQPLSFTLQATVMVLPSALTDTDLRGADAVYNANRYVVKLRRIGRVQ